MQSSDRAPASRLVTLSATWRDYYALGKPRIVVLIVFTAVVGILLAPSAVPEPAVIICATGGSG